MTEEDILENIEKIMDEKETQSSKFSISNFISIFVLNWQYFLISIIIFLSGAFLYLRYTEPTFSISARLLIKDEDSRKSRNASQMITNMMDLGFMSKSVGLENEIEIIKSRVLLRDVIRDLKLYSEYRLKGHLKDIIIYGKQPFAIELDADHLDSLDNEFIVSGQFTAMNLKIQKKDEKIIVEESISRPSSKRGDDKHVFTQELDSLRRRDAHHDSIPTLRDKARQRLSRDRPSAYGRCNEILGFNVSGKGFDGDRHCTGETCRAERPARHGLPASAYGLL